MDSRLTPQEAIIELNKIKSHTAGISDVDRRDRAIETAKDALEMRTKRKPIPEDNDNADFLLCPNCRKSVGMVDDVYDLNAQQNFCYNCGQSLDWEADS